MAKKDSTRKKLPTSKAKTAYGLLSEIAALGIAEPKRISMAVYLTHREDGDEAYFSDYPPCGTVGCIAGWATVLKPRYRARVLDSWWGKETENAGNVAARILGLSEDQGTELFRDEPLMGAHSQQTPQHARAVARHIRKFQKANRAQLLAKKL